MKYKKANVKKYLDSLFANNIETNLNNLIYISKGGMNGSHIIHAI